MSKTGEIRRDEICVDNTPKGVQLIGCHNQKGNQLWVYSELTKHLKNGGFCMAINDKRDTLVMELCNNDKLSQKWIIENFNSTRIEI